MCPYVCLIFLCVIITISVKIFDISKLIKRDFAQWLIISVKKKAANNYDTKKIVTLSSNGVNLFPLKYPNTMIKTLYSPIIELNC